MRYSEAGSAYFSIFLKSMSPFCADSRYFGKADIEKSLLDLSKKKAAIKSLKISERRATTDADIWG